MNKRIEKKELLLERGLEVMQRCGYNGTSVKDIVDAAKVPKGSFYTYFESKEHFAIEAITMAADASYQDSKILLSDNALPPMQRLEQFFRVNSEHASCNNFQIGCFLGNMCQEMADNNEQIRCITQRMMQRQIQLIGDTIAAGRDAQAEAKLSSLMLAEFIYNAWQGALLKMKSVKSDQPFIAFLSVLPTLIEH